MTLGDVLRKERNRLKLPLEKVASELGLSVEQYKDLEDGKSPIEEWGPKLAAIAVKLSTPTSRLISETGKSAQAKQKVGQCGILIRRRRESCKMTQEDLANQLEVSIDNVITIESGKSPLEVYSPLLLRFAELINQPIFNLFYPCGLPLEKLEDYP
jgi:transcriptional regulator with XRE-family HTH domain